MTLRSATRIALASLLFAAAGFVRADPLADPTRPFSATRAGPARVVSEFTVTAVINAPSRRVAIVNGAVVQAGSRVGEARILEILPDGLRYERNGREFTIRIASLAVRVRAPASTVQTAKAAPAIVESHEVSP